MEEEENKKVEEEKRKKPSEEASYLEEDRRDEKIRRMFAEIERRMMEECDRRDMKIEEGELRTIAAVSRVLRNFRVEIRTEIQMTLAVNSKMTKRDREVLASGLDTYLMEEEVLTDDGSKHGLDKMFAWSVAYDEVNNSEAETLKEMKRDFESRGLHKLVNWNSKGRIDNAYVLPKHKDLERWRTIALACSEPTMTDSRWTARALNYLLEKLPGAEHFNLNVTTMLKQNLKKVEKKLHIWGLPAAAPTKVKKMDATIARYGLYEFVVMPFGLCNAPGTFQHAMNRIFHDYLDKFVIVYLDDILIFSRTVEEHVEHLDKVLSLLRQHKFKINGETCEFGIARILYLGHEISADGLKPDDTKVASIRDWPRPQSVTEMRSFLGMKGYYRTFVKNYSIVAAPLTDLTCLDTPWEWTDKCEAAFRHLKHALTHYEVLKLPDPDKPFVVTTDASQYGIGSVLAQQEGPKLRPVEYMSKKMSSQKLAKSTYEKELYAVYKALTHWRHYLLGRFFILKTDHQTLRWMKTQPVLSDALKRWIEVIEQYDFDPQYLKGAYNKVVDALSRRPDFSGALITEFDLTDDVTRSLVEAYREDQFMSEIIRRLEAKDKKTSAEFEVVNDLLFLEKPGNKRLCVPNRESLRSLFLGECHDATGHFGYKKTATNLLQRFWWPTMMRDAQLYVETCQVCQRDKPRTQAPLGFLKPRPIPERPGESLSMDFMDTLVTSKSRMRHIFVIVDRFSKYARLVAMSETVKTEYVIRLFKENWVRDFGLPKSIVSDRDVRFTSELWKAAAAE
ncbi:hypothetical protein CBR_g26081 [Chara braunii]|uniref:Integrase catalytic domain-containing protein n=1 Tax=Chara braunii TaxID=69332 RepID=A0A388JVX8_CHABU|nr:hypothetical protein CBR_g26081 [Chara braunii]|eukprot:GBG61917.1 hypothetical protein CBR_g26081 [Chara braunii]